MDVIVDGCGYEWLQSLKLGGFWLFPILCNSISAQSNVLNCVLTFIFNENF